MPLKGSGFLALWNDFDPAREAEYECWHTFEHVPERVGVAGFLSGRRYRAADRAEGRYFTLYELEGLAALDGPDYADVVARPTEWSLSMRLSFRNFHRAPCETLATAGTVRGGCIGTMGFETPGGPPDAGATLFAPLSAALLEMAGITSLHLGGVDPGASFPLQQAPVVRGPGNTAHVLLVEGTSRAGLDRAEPRIREALLRSGVPGDGAAWATFDLASATDRSDLPEVGGRQPARPDLHLRHRGGQD